ncbi:unnamed protein product, partial [Protopolystoma xenopodis]
HLISSHLISSHLISSHLTSPHFTSSQLAPANLICPHFTSLQLFPFLSRCFFPPKPSCPVFVGRFGYLPLPDLAGLSCLSDTSLLASPVPSSITFGQPVALTSPTGSRSPSSPNNLAGVRMRLKPRGAQFTGLTTLIAPPQDMCYYTYTAPLWTFRIRKEVSPHFATSLNAHLLSLALTLFLLLTCPHLSISLTLSLSSLLTVDPAQREADGSDPTGSHLLPDHQRPPRGQHRPSPTDRSGQAASSAWPHLQPVPTPNASGPRAHVPPDVIWPSLTRLPNGLEQRPCLFILSLPSTSYLSLFPSLPLSLSLSFSHTHTRTFTFCICSLGDGHAYETAREAVDKPNHLKKAVVEEALNFPFYFGRFYPVQVSRETTLCLHLTDNLNAYSPRPQVVHSLESKNAGLLGRHSD